MAQEHVNVALVVGVTGIVGNSLASLLSKSDSRGAPWKIYGIGLRQKPAWISQTVHYVQVDLLDRDQTLANLSHLTDVTHLFWAAWALRATEVENIRDNVSMLRNVVDSLLPNAKGLAHVSLTTGGKHYVGPFELFQKLKLPEPPFREDLPRIDVPNFYYDLEDLVVEAAKKKEGSLTWSVHRPAVVFGFAPRNYMNIVGTLAVYAAICKHEGKPLAFPGNKYAWEKLTNASDADLIASQEIWAALNPRAQNQAFNTINGDVFTWKRLWPLLAHRYGLEVPPYNGEGVRLEELLQDKGQVWDEIVKAHGLAPTKLHEVAQFWFADIAMNVGPLELILDTNKSKEYGFLEFRDTEKSFLYWVDKLKESKIVP